ncbi:hypothetical protein NPIL_329611 [Nephila pilipes]|uniref:Uncharacterized protein n=1 Tax=Nephila pilipes TaxID=299642 RepID=A0A8X6U1J6_NEPPI|nr:hypothetical protein NPIL_329611 [Nephila pilipes]
MKCRMSQGHLLAKGTGLHDKSWHYDYLKLLLGIGLITRYSLTFKSKILLRQLSSVEKWRPRRKLLAPCFHTDILRGFLTIFNERSQTLVEHLRQETKKEFTNIGTPVTLTTLDIIYEAMLGSSVEALENNSAQYITTMKKYVVKIDLKMYLFIDQRIASRIIKLYSNFNTAPWSLTKSHILSRRSPDLSFQTIRHEVVPCGYWLTLHRGELHNRASTRLVIASRIYVIAFGEEFTFG